MIVLEELTQRQLLAQKCPAVLPLGATEVHNEDLPLGTDNFIARAVASLVCDQYGALLLPPLTYTYAGVTAELAGTISVALPAFTAYLAATFQALLRAGLGPVVVISAHGGNDVACLAAMEEVFHQRSAGLLYCNILGPAYHDLIRQVWGEADLVLAENACLWAALAVLGHSGLSRPVAPTQAPNKPEHWARIGTAGHLAHTYRNPHHHIAIRNVTDDEAGTRFLQLAASQIVSVLDDLQAFHAECLKS